MDLKYDVGISDKEELDLLQDMRLKCYNNLAAAQLKVSKLLK